MTDETRPNEFPHLPYSLEGHFQPWYDDRRDYNTNAPTYYDYLANVNHLPSQEAEAINKIAKRNIAFEESDCVEFTKIYDWIKDIPDENIHRADIVKVRANVITHTEPMKFLVDEGGKEPTRVSFDNAIVCYHGNRRGTKGLFAPNYLPLIERNISNINMLSKNHTEYVQYVDGIINDLTTKVNGMVETVNNIKEENQRLRGAVQKFVDNLNYNGNATTNDISTFELVDGIACGNINVWTGQAGGGSLIRTHNGVHENDVTIGHI